MVMQIAECQSCGGRGARGGLVSVDWKLKQLDSLLRTLLYDSKNLILLWTSSYLDTNLS